ncbi:uncharacterized protein K452DRAFT_269841 [Aplosporella prunicola CBS 121167]|uniref:AAA+ ATPase domain-containing protein n=1 Tax=Aplosporella prunicola CBS 121167 TaxID=1176127 RepID=A0A6A6BDM7_9PEZI|nr:uncharacterized protein K452DRAFT_269841 [Aplosporella prunicola CBS 121167]KAF2142280.1 hypothetical protein K452DRAFT_269841 [Aplosporella prunicola CBS 121167]
MSESTKGPADDAFASLEKKYIRLLEQKITALENSIAAHDTTCQKATDLPRSGSGAKHEGQKVENSLNAVDSHKDGEREDSSDEQSGPKSDVNEDVPNSRVRLLDSRYNESSGVWEEGQSKMASRSKEMGPELEYAFTWLRTFDDKQKYENTKVTINSANLEAIIKNVCRASSQSNFRSFSSRMPPSPSFAPLVWDWDELNKTALDTDESVSEDTKQARKDLSLLLEQIRLCPELQPYFEKRKSLSQTGEMEYEYLWTLFPPGEMVFAKPIQDCPQAFITREAGEYSDITRRNGRTDSYFELSCWSYDWNGETFNRVPGTLKIEKYIGPKAINTLLFYPIKYHSSLQQTGEDPANQAKEESILSFLKERGQVFRKFCISQKGSQLFWCDGPVFSRQLTLGEALGATNFAKEYDSSSTINSDDDGSDILRTSKVVGPVIIDHKAYLQYSGQGFWPFGSFAVEESVYECTCAECKRNNQLKNMMKVNYDKWDRNTPFEEDDQYIICPSRVLGYIMNLKVWAQMPLQSIHEIKKKIRKDAFDNLIMDPNAKDLIRGLVGNHEKKKHGSQSSMSNEDWIEGKGKGLVILLHGPPGVGKTSTAESVAQATGKPLFAVSVSDIGLKPDKVEKSLSEIFKLAAMWEAVLLFDEADVFLESRGTDKGDLTRNTLVTVFLRILEYYDGILILTTNRIKSFDIAVQSRVHLAIRYKELSTDQLKELFRTFIRQHKNDIENEKEVEKWIKDDFDYEFDGRQIRNIISSARALAKADDNPSGRVHLRHIKSVLRMTQQFQNHLRDQRVAAQRDQVSDK